MCRHNHKDTPLAWAAAAVVAVVLNLGVVPPALAGDVGPLELNPARVVADANLANNLALAQAEEPSEPIAARAASETVQERAERGLPISLKLGYALYSDYIWRGVNCSEYRGEGREKPNHQLSTSIGFDLGELFGAGTDIGTLYFDTWYEWFAGQKKLDPDRGGQNLQEVNFVLYWTYNIEPLETELTLGYKWYLFPNRAHTLRQDRARGNNNDDRTHEYWFSLTHNDAWLWQWLLPNNEDGILNPSFFFAHDVGAVPGVWMEFGLSHEFAVPGVDNLTITPAYTVCIDGDYWTRGFKLAGDQWSLDTTYDLTPLLHLPEWAGSVSISGRLYFFNAFGNMEDAHVIQDEFWGGMAVDWSWGG